MRKLKVGDKVVFMNNEASSLMSIDGNLSDGSIGTIYSLHEAEAGDIYPLEAGPWARVDFEGEDGYWDVPLSAISPPFKWTVEFTVDPTWVQDGFNPDTDDFFDMLCKRLPFANSNELGAKLISAPDQELVAKVQGFKNAAEMAGASA